MQFRAGVRQPLRLTPRRLDAGAVRVQCLARFALRRPKPRNLRGFGFEPAKGVHQSAMRRGVDQRTLVMLTINLNQRHADGLERLHAHGLIVDQRARSPIGELHTPQNQFILGRYVIRAQDRVCGMLTWYLEHGRDLPLLDPMAHQAGVAARTKRQREGIEQDRFPGAGLAGEHREAGCELHVEAIDQDDVADREAGKHGRVARDAPLPLAGVTFDQGDVRVRTAEPKLQRGRIFSAVVERFASASEGNSSITSRLNGRPSR